MHEFFKIIGRLLFFAALLFHFALMALFFAPTTFLLSKTYEVELLHPEDIPEEVKKTLEKNDSLLSPKPDFDKTKSLRDRIFMSLLEFRCNHFMEDEEKLAFELSTLDFGEEVIGLEAASQYYFKKPLFRISEPQWVTLINLHTIFLNY